MGQLVVDWDGLFNGFKSEVVAGLKDFAEGAEEDLKEFGAAIAKDLVRAVKESRPELLEELKHQALALAEVQRIRLNKAAWDQFGKVLAALGRGAMKALALASAAI